MYRIAVKELQERRQHLGLSSQEVAEKLAVSDSLVSLWECGKKQPSSTMFFNWVTVLGFNFILNVHQSKNILHSSLGATTGTFDHDGQRTDALSGSNVETKYPKFKFN